MNIRQLFGLLATLVLIAACGKSDVDITDGIRTQLVADDTVRAHTIDVVTRDRVVTLSGTAESERERERALEIARATEGVTEVVNNITVMPAETEASARTGTTGESALRSELPRTASPLPLIVLIGTLSLVAGIALMRLRRMTDGVPQRSHRTDSEPR